MFQYYGPVMPVLRRQVTIHSNPSLQTHFTPDSPSTAAANPRSKNIILFGETGVGKSSVINLMAGRDIAKTSGNLRGCTLKSMEYWFGLSAEISVRIFDTVGLEEADTGNNSFMGAIEKAYQLVQTLHSSGGIDLLLFCIRGGRMTTATQRSHRLFYEVLCASKVPLAIVVTHLEREVIMEDWWVENENTLRSYGIRAVGHACVTADPIIAHAKWTESRMILRNMLHDILTKPNPAYMRDVWDWFLTTVQQLRSYFPEPKSLRKKKLVRRLERRCMLSRDDAKRLAQMVINGDKVA